MQVVGIEFKVGWRLAIELVLFSLAKTKKL